MEAKYRTSVVASIWPGSADIAFVLRQTSPECALRRPEPVGAHPNDPRADGIFAKLTLLEEEVDPSIGPSPTFLAFGKQAFSPADALKLTHQ
jgi:hypothetical protein